MVKAKDMRKAVNEKIRLRRRLGVEALFNEIKERSADSSSQSAVFNGGLLSDYRFTSVLKEPKVQRLLARLGYKLETRIDEKLVGQFFFAGKVIHEQHLHYPVYTVSW